MRSLKPVLLCLFVGLLALGLVMGNMTDTLAADEVKIKIAGARVDDPWYAFSQALANFINKKSSWLRAESVATAGLTANIEMIAQKPTEYIGLAPTSTTLHARPGHDWSKKRKPYTGATFIANLTTMTQVLATFDPEIKSVKDLKGKTVDVGRKGAGNTPDHLAILKAYGVLDDVKLTYTGFGGGVKKMMDGFCEASFLIINHTYPQKFSKGPLIEQLETRKPVYYVGFDQQLLLDLREKEYGTVPVRIPAGALGENQKTDIWGFNDPVYLMADKTMDPKIVEEVTRVIFETPADEWVKWHPQGEHMTTQFKTATPGAQSSAAPSGHQGLLRQEGHRHDRPGRSDEITPCFARIPRRMRAINPVKPVWTPTEGFRGHGSNKTHMRLGAALGGHRHGGVPAFIHSNPDPGPRGTPDHPPGLRHGGGLPLPTGQAPAQAACPDLAGAVVLLRTGHGLLPDFAG